MTLRVHIAPIATRIPENTGIGRVVHAQYRYLPEHGIELVEHPGLADVVAAHTNGEGLARLDVLHLHGMYWTGDLGSGRYSTAHHEINARIAADARRARTITVPSGWVAMPFRRDMRIAPTVIGHGIDMDTWPLQQDGENVGYVLWNKSRAADVCDPTPAAALAARDVEVITTFAPEGFTHPRLLVTGALPHDKMCSLIRHADVYLATTKETFGIGTLEAMACGVPVLGYRWGGTAEIVEHQVSGYLTDPGDIDGLMAGLTWLRAHRAEVSAAARERAAGYTWPAIMAQYAALYRQVAAERSRERHGVAVVIPCYNYGHWLDEAVASCLAQRQPPDQIIIVNDGSTDDTGDRADTWRMQYPELITVVHQPNAGVAAARNVGIARTDLPYIVCLDADDRLDPYYIERLAPALDTDPALGVAYTGLGFIQPNGTVMPTTSWPPPFDWATQARGGVPPANCIPSAAMFRRAMWERAGGYKQEYAPGEDAEFWTRGLATGFTARRVTRAALFHYRSHERGAHATRTYVPIDTWHPWMRDGKYLFAAPMNTHPLVRSYSQPAISVIITDDIAETLDRLLGQTVREWEAIVIGVEPLPSCFCFARRAATLAEARAKAQAPIVIEADGGTLDSPQTLEGYLEDYITMSKRCCGGSGGAAVLAAKQALDQPEEHDTGTATTGSSLVRMEFIGMRTGSVTFRINGQPYRGGNNKIDKFVNARPEDVAGLERTGQWRQVRRERPAPAPAPTPIQEHVTATAAETPTARSRPRRREG